ncbi:hypothetical protein NB703_003081 [Pantoea ananatis]|uniref:Putative tail fiber protein gp53-like C-terminal domain-containing protein n=1 Tax=Pantoea ananas TaxID=553 RepID=A0AAJ1D0E4_PANAN|nr:phage tail protein [Pantoea ananatis]MCW0344988.1 hypothetical protein [Pantoea ananatis]
MSTNNFKPFATGANANVTAQADYENLAALATGFQSGKASSAQINKALRQSSFVAAAIAQYMANKTNSDILDNGDISNFMSLLITALKVDLQAANGNLNALSALQSGTDLLPYFSGANAASLTAFTSVARDIVGKKSVADLLTYLGIGSAGTRNVGTGQNQIPDMTYWQSNAGWRKTPDGVIEQWGTSAATTDTVSVTFPIQFSSAVYWIGEHDTGGGNRLTLWQLNSITGTGFQARNLGSIIKGDNAVEASISANCIWYARGK